MTPRIHLLATLGLIAVAILLGIASVQAQSPPDGPVPAEPGYAEKLAKESDVAGSAANLALEEQRIAEKYKHLEDVLLRMAELNAASDPHRAALLKKAVGQSKDQLIGVRLDRLVDLLGKDQLSRALENQRDVDQDLHALLELLMSENRAKRIESEKARIREYLKQIGGIIKQQKDVQGRTTAGDKPDRLSDEQGQIANKTGQLANELRKEADQKTDDGKEGQKDGGKESPKNNGKSSGKEAESGSPPPQQPPTHERLESAKQRMQEAQDQLKKAQRQGATEKQEEAIRQLQLAKADLEEILRQLREEEIERTLAMLEARFRKMLQMQEEVYEGTTRLDKVPETERTHNQEIEASRLSGKESQIVVEIDKALLLLRDDGSAVAMLEATQQIHDDMQQVVERLAQGKVGAMTQSVEEDIMASLKEAIEALAKAQKDLESKKTPPGQQPPPGEQPDPPLVDVLAELKMIRALQMRVNTRTARYAKMIDGEEADNVELRDALRRLAERQQRIQRVTHDLQMGKNQ